MGLRNFSSQAVTFLRGENDSMRPCRLHHLFGNLVFLLGLSVHAGCESLPRVESLVKVFREHHHVDDFKVIIRLLLVRHL